MVQSADAGEKALNTDNPCSSTGFSSNFLTMTTGTMQHTTKHSMATNPEHHRNTEEAALAAVRKCLTPELTHNRSTMVSQY